MNKIEQDRLLLVVKRWRDGYGNPSEVRKALSTLVAENEGLIVSAAKPYFNRLTRQGIEELLQECRLALYLYLAERHDPERASMSTGAWPWIKQACTKYTCSQANTLAIPTHAWYGFKHGRQITPEVRRGINLALAQCHELTEHQHGHLLTTERREDDLPPEIPGLDTLTQDERSLLTAYLEFCHCQDHYGLMAESLGWERHRTTKEFRRLLSKLRRAAKRDQPESDERCREAGPVLIQSGETDSLCCFNCA